MMRSLPLALAALLAAAPLPAGAQSAAVTPTIMIEGQASADVVPDTATVSLGVVTERPRAVDAVGENARAAASVIASIKAAGVEARDIATTEIGLTPVLDQPEGGARPGAPGIVGYTARNALTFRTRLTDGLGALLAKLVDGGANAVDGLSFSNAGESMLRDGLRADAARDARRQAEIYAAALGLKLGRVLEVRPGQDPGFQAPVMAVMKRGGPVPVEAGQQRLAERVSVTFELLP